MRNLLLKAKSLKLTAIFALLIIFSASCLSADRSASAKEVWRLDGTDEKVLPRNFRIVESFNESASAQPSRGGISELYKKISTVAPAGFEIYMVDLRQESHGFADGYPVSWYVDKNRGNFYIGSDEVEDREIEQLKNLRGVKTEFVPLGKTDTKTLQPIKFAPKKTETEREVATAAGFKYVRFAATDMIFPAPKVVDEFINFVQTLPENSWLHFHCHAGHGRTTTFLVMYDILKNPELPLEEICERQHKLGGSNLLALSSGTDFYATANNDRAEKIKLFYKFAHIETAETWSEFLLKNLGD